MLKLDPSEPAGRNVQFAVNGTFYGVACEEPDDSEGDNPGPNLLSRSVRSPCDNSSMVCCEVCLRRLRA
jgi:hypothetical protein